jgi:hypothetical protein
MTRFAQCARLTRRLCPPCRGAQPGDRAAAAAAAAAARGDERLLGVTYDRSNFWAMAFSTASIMGARRPKLSPPGGSEEVEEGLVAPVTSFMVPAVKDVRAMGGVVRVAPGWLAVGGGSGEGFEPSSAWRCTRAAGVAACGCGTSAGTAGFLYRALAACVRGVGCACGDLYAWAARAPGDLPSSLRLRPAGTVARVLHAARAARAGVWRALRCEPLYECVCWVRCRVVRGAGPWLL